MLLRNGKRKAEDTPVLPSKKRKLFEDNVIQGVLDTMPNELLRYITGFHHCMTCHIEKKTKKFCDKCIITHCHTVWYCEKCDNCNKHLNFVNKNKKDIGRCVKCSGPLCLITYCDFVYKTLRSKIPVNYAVETYNCTECGIKKFVI